MRVSCCYLLLVFLLLLSSFAPRSAGAGEWKKGNPPLATRWFSEAGPEQARPEYPNPAMAREAWMNLNGLWRYAIRPRGEQLLDQPGPAPAAGWEGEILVPWPVESALSGVQRPVSPEQRLWYSRTFTVPAEWRKKKILLHFEAVDWQSQVWVNGIEVGYHEGGYDAFSFDITPALRFAGDEVVTVAVWDPTDTGTQPRGKQVLKPGGIFYTACTGIWGTVWVEPVPVTRIEELRIVPDVAAGAVTVTCTVAGALPRSRLALTALEEGRIVASASGAADAPIRLAIPGARLWSPATPHLYDLKVQLIDREKVTDEVSSYFGLRSITVGPDQAGVTRLLLNGEPLFQAGPLDQGFWPDGIYTAPTEEAMVYDLEVLKRMGFNMLRKHVKVEPRRFYYHCDRLGVLVWQDMPSGDQSL
ncbi:MAG TPA: glycoside hydrolase family 2, partial [bacterium]|nr:glycoside hydrolase family 2 [bacterium]